MVRIALHVALVLTYEAVPCESSLAPKKGRQSIHSSIQIWLHVSALTILQIIVYYRLELETCMHAWQPGTGKCIPVDRSCMTVTTKCKLKQPLSRFIGGCTFRFFCYFFGFMCRFATFLAQERDHRQRLS